MIIKRFITLVPRYGVVVLLLPKLSDRRPVSNGPTIAVGLSPPISADERRSVFHLGSSSTVVLSRLLLVHSVALYCSLLCPSAFSCVCRGTLFPSV